MQKRSLSNGDSFFPKSQAADEEALQAENFTKFAATASDPDSSGLQSSNSHEARAALKDTNQGPSEEAKSNTDDSKSQDAAPKNLSGNKSKNAQQTS